VADVSRARNIKPGFFKNDVLAECDALARILFAGLWCEADRAGRLEDRPKKIKAECLPYEILLGQLVSKGFILRYEIGGRRYIQIIAFTKHQNPHKNEAISSIPAPELYGASTVQVPSPDGSTPADSYFPFPDSLIPSEIDTPAGATSAGEAGIAMRKAGCASLNLSHIDFLAALAEGVTADELANAVEAAKGRGIAGAGLFAYAIGIARTNHAKTATVVALPAARAGPGAAPPQSKTQLASQNIWDTVNAFTERNSELDSSGDRPGLGQAPVAQLGRSSGA